MKEENRSFPNWDCVEVRERYYKKKEGSESMEKEEAIKALEEAVQTFARAYSRRAIQNFVEAIDAALHAGLSSKEVDEVIRAASEAERRKKEVQK